jgi:hypothetical protein
MGESEEFLAHSLVENLIAIQLGDKKLEEGEEGCSTPKKKLTFASREGAMGSFKGNGQMSTHLKH